MTSASLSAAAFLLLFLALVGLAAWKDSSLPWQGVKDGIRGFVKVAPMMVLAFCAAALITRLIPEDSFVRWLGANSGWRGLGLATLAGFLTPGGPFIQFPIVAALYDRGVRPGPLVAYLSAWSLVGVHRFFIFEVPLLGWKFSLCRLGLSCLFPPLLGRLTQELWNRWLD